jgi:hypothetical protein
MQEAQTPLPHLAQLFLDVVCCILPRDSFQDDTPALLRLCMVRKRLVEDMRQSNGGFGLDLHVSTKNVVMVSPYPSCHLACLNKFHFQAFKRMAARFQSVNRLSIDLQTLPCGCNFMNTRQIVDLVFHCLAVGKAKELHISHAVFDAQCFTDRMRHLFRFTKEQIVSVHLSHCKLVINSAFLRQLASMRNLKSLVLDGSKFDLISLAFPGFSDKLESLSLAGCGGVRAMLLTKVSKTLQSLVWNDNVLLEAEKPFFLAWIADSRLRSLDVDNCAFHPHDAEGFQAALARMRCLSSLSIARNDFFENLILWSMYEHWRCGHVPSPFNMHVSNMKICFVEHGAPVFLGGSEFGRIDVED